jgi:hypothetical protein
LKKLFAIAAASAMLAAPVYADNDGAGTEAAA